MEEKKQECPGNLRTRMRDSSGLEQEENGMMMYATKVRLCGCVRNVRHEALRAKQRVHNFASDEIKFQQVAYMHEKRSNTQNFLFFLPD